jgi:RimJ/RimL family protein N-acetyltransferase
MTSAEQLSIRPLTADDRGALARLPERVSPQSAIARFHGAVRVLTDDLLDRLVDLESGRREAVVAIDGHGVAGIARYVRDDADESRAEVAVLVVDEWQRRGVATLMLRPLVASALAAGITHFWADTPPENTAARHLLANLATTVSPRFMAGRTIVVVDLRDGFREQ